MQKRKHFIRQSAVILKKTSKLAARKWRTFHEKNDQKSTTLIDGKSPAACILTYLGRHIAKRGVTTKD